MTLPIVLQMRIDLSAAAHKREIAEGFARLSKKLSPTPKGPTLQDLCRNVFNDADWQRRMASQQMAAYQGANSAWGKSTVSGLGGTLSPCGGWLLGGWHWP
jgi:hypothetical protein